MLRGKGPCLRSGGLPSTHLGCDLPAWQFYYGTSCRIRNMPIPCSAGAHLRPRPPPPCVHVASVVHPHALYVVPHTSPDDQAGPACWGSTWVHPHACRMPHAPCPIPRGPCLMPHASCCMPRAARPTSVGSSTLTPMPPSAHSLKKGSIMATAAPLGSATVAARIAARSDRLAGSMLYTYSCGCKLCQRLSKGTAAGN